MFEGTATREADYSFHDLIREQKMKVSLSSSFDVLIVKQQLFVWGACNFNVRARQKDVNLKC